MTERKTTRAKSTESADAKKDVSATKGPSAASKTPAGKTSAAKMAAVKKSASKPRASKAAAAKESETADAAPKNEPIDAEFTPAGPGADAIAFLKKDSISMPTAIALAVAAAIVGGLIGVVFGGGDDGGRAARELASRLDAQEQRLDGVRDALTGAEGASLDAAAFADVTAEVDGLREEMSRLAARLAVVEASSGDRESAAEIADRLQDVIDDVAEARRMAQEALDGPAADADAIADLDSRLTSLGDAVTAQQRALNQLNSATSRIASRLTGVRAPVSGEGTGPAAALALAELQDAAREGRPFASELADLRSYVGDMGALDALGAYADDGAQTPLQIAGDFRAVSRRVRAAETAGGGIIDRFGRALTGLVTVRRLDAPETSAPGDIVARARARINEDDLAGAVIEMERLQGPAAAAAANWIADAKRRIELDARLAALGEELRGE